MAKVNQKQKAKLKMLMKLTTVLVLGLYDYNFQATQAAMVVEKMADYLSKNNA